MAIVGWAIGGVLLGIAGNADYSDHSDYSNYSNYSDYSDYSDIVERNEQRQRAREQEIENAEYDLEIFFQSEMLPFLQQNSIPQDIIDNIDRYDEIEDEFAFECKMEKIRSTQQLNDELVEIEALIGKIDTIRFNID